MGGGGGMGYGALGLRQINTCRKVRLQVNLVDDDILLWFLYFSIKCASTSNSEKLKGLSHEMGWNCVGMHGQI